MFLGWFWGDSSEDGLFNESHSSHLMSDILIKFRRHNYGLHKPFSILTHVDIIVVAVVSHTAYLYQPWAVNKLFQRIAFDFSTKNTDHVKVNSQQNFSPEMGDSKIELSMSKASQPSEQSETRSHPQQTCESSLATLWRESVCSAKLSLSGQFIHNSESRCWNTNEGCESNQRFSWSSAPVVPPPRWHAAPAVSDSGSLARGSF